MARIQSNRSINREKFQVSRLEAQLSDPAHRRYRVFENLSRMLRVRRKTPAFDPAAGFRVESSPQTLFILRRGNASTGFLVAVHNVTAQIQPLPESLLNEGPWVDRLDGGILEAAGPSLLKPYEVRWLARAS